MRQTELMEKKGKSILLLKELCTENGLKENGEVFLNISERSAGLRNVKKPKSLFA